VAPLRPRAGKSSPKPLPRPDSPASQVALRTVLARVLHCRRGMNPTPSPWLLGWMAVGSFAAVVASCVHALQRAAALP